MKGAAATKTPEQDAETQPDIIVPITEFITSNCALFEESTYYLDNFKKAVTTILTTERSLAQVFNICISSGYLSFEAALKFGYLLFELGLQYNFDTKELKYTVFDLVHTFHDRAAKSFVDSQLYPSDDEECEEEDSDGDDDE
jgi:hypothetical protein